jgi:hypothetical protein
VVPPLHPHLVQVKHMFSNMGSHDGNPDHAFPQLAGSHLSEVRPPPPCWPLRPWPPTSHTPGIVQVGGPQLRSLSQKAREGIPSRHPSIC